jgi:predicted AAA+ superfamily ATPase
MKRQLIERLWKWKKSERRKPLILLGARQVGKTWLMKEFGKTAYPSVAYVNCDDEPRAAALFNQDYDIPRILLTLQTLCHTKIVPGETLIILDELQEAPRGLSSLKYFQEKAPEYHVMAAGSLLGVTMGQKQSFPVGKVDMLNLYPLNFEEFLCGLGEESLVEWLHRETWDSLPLFHDKLVSLLRQYYFVGGMPEAVNTFVETQDLQAVRDVQHAILAAYRNDFSKHTTKAESIRIGQVMFSLPSQLVKENKKFLYNLLKQGARAADYELAIQWLMDAGIVYKVSRVREARMPLKFYEDLSGFKLFLLDCGLLGCMASAPADQILIGDNVFKEFKGAFTEQYVLQQLVTMDFQPYYWSSEKSTSEIDFIVQQGARVVPIEVKAEQNVRSRSLSTYINSHPDLSLKGLRISMMNYVNQEWMENIPLYGIAKYFS